MEENAKQGSGAGLTFVHRHRVTYSECTIGNHVYYARYWDWLEAARGEWFRALGCAFAKLQEEGFLFPVIEARIRYRNPARYDEIIRIELWAAEPRRSFLEVESVGIREPEETPIFTAWTRHLCAGLDNRPRRLPEKLATALRPYLRQS